MFTLRPWSFGSIAAHVIALSVKRSDVAKKAKEAEEAKEAKKAEQTDGTESHVDLGTTK